MIILNEVIKWGSIIACIVWPVYIIKKGCITYVIEKRISATESKKNEILWTDWKNDEELKRTVSFNLKNRSLPGRRDFRDNQS